MVQVNKGKLEHYVKEIEATPELRRAKIFVENFFGTVGNQTLKQAYWNYLDDLLVYSPTNEAIRDNTTYLCFVFKDVTGGDMQTMAYIEYLHHGPPKIYPLE